MTTPAAVDLGEYDLFAPDIQQCPYPYFAAMREQEPVFATVMNGRPIWLITTYELCLAVVSNPAQFSSKFGTPGLPPSSELGARLRALRAEHGAYKFVPTLLTADPPEHSRYRKLVSRAFTPRATAALEDGIRTIVQSLLELWPVDGTVEFVSALAWPFPVRVIAKALNVPESDLDDFKRWSDDTMAAQGSEISDERRIEAELGIIEFQHYFIKQIADRRATPRDDLLTNLVEAMIDPSDPDADGPDPVRLNDAEILSILQQLLVAGNETTTKALSEMMLLLARHPERWAAVRTQPDTHSAVIEESLRLSTPGLAMWRVATSDVELGGVQIPKGARLLVLYGSANRDTDEFPAGDGFCPEQASTKHLAFGKGAHFCIGAGLARLELRVALAELAARLQSVSLSEDNDLRYTPSFMLRGLESLSLQITSAR